MRTLAKKSKLSLTGKSAVNGAYLSGNYITSFIGFLPADDPQVVIYIAVDNAKGVTQYGGTVAAPIAKNFMLSAIDVLDIEKRENELEREYLYTDKQYAIVPNVIGMNVKDAIKKSEIIWIKLYGENIKKEKPFKVL